MTYGKRNGQADKEPVLDKLKGLFEEMLV